jgi:tRNA pseudouridine55 synthase
VDETLSAELAAPKPTNGEIPPGVVIVNKPTGWTSHDVVAKMRRIARTRKIGHLGTLDPLATGVLPLLIGRATRLAQFFTRNDKVYEGTIHFGYSTDSYDCDGRPTSAPVDVLIDRETLDAIFDRFRGTFLQMPPAVSAKKIGGRRAYELARKNLPVELTAVEVTVTSLDILEILDQHRVRIRLRCSAGTYVRSIAHEAGQALGCGAFLQQLCRTASGDFHLDQARTLEELAALSAEDRFQEAVIPAGGLLPQFPIEIVDSITAAQIRQGRNFRVSPFLVRAEAGDANPVKAVTAQGELVAIGAPVLPHVYHPILVF